MISPPITLTELEERLMAANGEVLKNQLLLRITGIEFRLRQNISTGIPREIFALWQSALAAAEAAKDVLKMAPCCLESSSSVNPAVLPSSFKANVFPNKPNEV